ncbi:MAG: hypothetical protein AAF420_13195 [Pseudomonadota bacterium]
MVCSGYREVPTSSFKLLCCNLGSYLSFDELPEPHPFTISKVSTDGTIRFTVKALGDYTQALQTLVTPGMSVGVKGAYGGFTRRHLVTDIRESVTSLSL